MKHVIGFDLSLTAPGVVALPLDWKPGDWKRAQSWLLKTKDPKNKDDQDGHLRRYIQIADWARSIVDLFPGAGVFIESYGFSKNNASASRIMESGGITRYFIYQAGLLTRNVTASEARKLLLGFNPCKPNDPKVVVQDALFNKCGAPKTWDENQCDAFVVANFGLSECGGTVLSLG